MPNIIEIEITVVNNETAKRFSDIAAWKDTNSLSYRQNARTFTARMRLPTDTAITVTLPSVPGSL